MSEQNQEAAQPPVEELVREVVCALSDLADEATRQVTLRWPAPYSGGDFKHSMDTINDAYQRGRRAVLALTTGGRGAAASGLETISKPPAPSEGET